MIKLFLNFPWFSFQTRPNLSFESFINFIVSKILSKLIFMLFPKLQFALGWSFHCDKIEKLCQPIVNHNDIFHNKKRWIICPQFKAWLLLQFLTLKWKFCKIQKPLETWDWLAALKIVMRKFCKKLFNLKINSSFFGLLRKNCRMKIHLFWSILFSQTAACMKNQFCFVDFTLKWTVAWNY
jgi:hypothetical protein